ncbi:MAG TPA: hypothetical protein VJA21_29710 [Verrucomicrobiae bacterium]
MSRASVLGLVAASALGGAAVWRALLRPAPEPVFEARSRPPQLAPICPWRDPQGDLPKLFPGASRWEVEARVLSGLRPEVAARLGRTPTANENVARVYRIYRGDEPAGEVMTTRVKGTYGAIELVVAADEGGRLKRVLVQRSREPETVTEALRSSDWSRWLEGKRADSSWECGDALAALKPEAHETARAMVEGVRSSLVLLSVSERAPPPTVAQSHSH